MACLNTQLKELVRSLRSKPSLLFVHSDLLKASFFVEKSNDRYELLNHHLDNIESLADGCPVWFPTFNYDFPKTREFHMEKSPSQVGPLSEFFRQHRANWRSADPVFSIAGTGPDCRLSSLVDEMTAFGETSFLAQLYEHNAILLFYGADLTAVTALHFAESMSGGPLYRYDKIFVGKCHSTDHSEVITYTYHVRPMGKVLKYDWQKITSDLKQSGIFLTVQEAEIDLAGIALTRPLIDFWLERLREDSLYFLNEESLAWVAPKIEELGRRFVLEDFE